MILSLPFHERWMTSQLCFLWNYQNEQWWCDWFELPRLRETCHTLGTHIPQWGYQSITRYSDSVWQAAWIFESKDDTSDCEKDTSCSQWQSWCESHPRLEAPEGERGIDGLKATFQRFRFQLAKAWNVCRVLTMYGDEIKQVDPNCGAFKSISICLVKQWGIPWILETWSLLAKSLHSLLQANSFSRNWAMVWSPMYRWGMVGWIDSSHWTILHFLAENLDDFRRMWYDHSGSTHAGRIWRKHPGSWVLGNSSPVPSVLRSVSWLVSSCAGTLECSQGVAQVRIPEVFSDVFK